MQYVLSCSVTFSSNTLYMASNKQLTGESLNKLLEQQRCTFTDQYRPLLTAQATALEKANTLIAESPESLKRNYPRKKANSILNDIKNCIGSDVYVLCALATTASALGTSNLGDYVSSIGSWWQGVQHPRGLTMISERHVTKQREESLHGKLRSHIV
jgi:hypothetical protein